MIKFVGFFQIYFKFLFFIQVNQLDNINVLTSYLGRDLHLMINCDFNSFSINYSIT